MATVFSKIITGEIPCHKVAEDSEFFAFLDISPVAAGHTLVVPKQEIDYIFDMDDPLLGRMMAFARRVAAAQKAAITCRRIGLTVIGLEVPHAHIHLIPLTRESDMYFGKERQKPSQEILAGIADAIRKEYK
jgi:histidine triad (HIT) family protein